MPFHPIEMTSPLGRWHFRRANSHLPFRKCYPVMRNGILSQRDGVSLRRSRTRSYEMAFDRQTARVGYSSWQFRTMKWHLPWGSGISPEEAVISTGAVGTISFGRSISRCEAAFPLTRWLFARSSRRFHASSRHNLTGSGISSLRGRHRSAEAALHPRKVTLHRNSRDNLIGN